MRTVSARAPFWLGLSAALGVLLAGAVLAGNRGRSAGDRPPPAADPGARVRMAVFSRPRKSRDTVPAAYVRHVLSLSGEHPGVPAQFRNGRIELEQSRLLLRNVGSRHVDLYAFPSARGLVCSLWIQKGSGAGGGCSSFTRTHPVGAMSFDPDGFGGRIPVSLGGLVPDDVTKIDVIVQGRAYRSTMRNNAYFFETPSPNARPEGVRVTFRSGRRTTISLPGLSGG